MKTLDLIRNADDRTMVDFRVDNQIDSVPIDDLRALLGEPTGHINHEALAKYVQSQTNEPKMDVITTIKGRPSTYR